MRFRLKVHCHNCSCDFLITSKYKVTSTITCPNCKNIIPDDFTEKLNACITALQEVPDKYNDDDPFTWDDKKAFSVEIIQPEFAD